MNEIAGSTEGSESTTPVPSDGLEAYVKAYDSGSDGEEGGLADAEVSEQSPQVVESQGSTEESLADSSESSTQQNEVEGGVKTYSYSVNGEAVEIPEDAVFTHKVEGQQVEIPLGELLSNYSGKVPWDRRYTELSQKEKAVEQKESELQAISDSFDAYVGELLTNPFEAQKKIAKLKGEDFDLKRLYQVNIASAINTVKQLNSMGARSSQQIEQLIEDLVQQEEQGSLSERAESVKTEQQKLEIQRHTLRAVREHNLTESQMEQAEKELLEKHVNLDGMSPEQRVEYVAQEALSYHQPRDMVLQAAQELDPMLLDAIYEDPDWAHDVIRKCRGESYEQVKARLQRALDAEQSGKRSTQEQSRDLSKKPDQATSEQAPQRKEESVKTGSIPPMLSLEAMLDFAEKI